jgi:hypothetical protein
MLIGQTFSRSTKQGELFRKVMAEKIINGIRHYKLIDPLSNKVSLANAEMFDAHFRTQTADKKIKRLGYKGKFVNKQSVNFDD